MKHPAEDYVFWVCPTYKRTQYIDGTVVHEFDGWRCQGGIRARVDDTEDFDPIVDETCGTPDYALNRAIQSALAYEWDEEEEEYWGAG